MVVIVKIKVVYAGLMRSKTYAENGSIVWIYNSLDESLHKGSQISRQWKDVVINI